MSPEQIQAFLDKMLNGVEFANTVKGRETIEKMKKLIKEKDTSSKQIGVQTDPIKQFKRRPTIIKEDIPAPFQLL